jgi:hypothetical protein
VKKLFIIPFAALALGACTVDVDGGYSLMKPMACLNEDGSIMRDANGKAYPALGDSSVGWGSTGLKCPGDAGYNSLLAASIHGATAGVLPATGTFSK